MSTVFENENWLAGPQDTESGSLFEFVDYDGDIDELDDEIRRRAARRPKPRMRPRPRPRAGVSRPAVSRRPRRGPPARGMRQSPRPALRRRSRTCVCPAHGTEFVRWVQQALNEIVGANLAVTGVMDAETRGQLRNFQQGKGLPVDGIAGPDTEKALMEARSRGQEAAPEATPTEQEMFLRSLFPSRYVRRRQAAPTVADRNSADYIRWVQQSLNTINRLRLDVDGILGPMTRSAVRDFQRQSGLAVDGVVGPMTERALIAAGAGQPPTGRAPSTAPAGPAPAPAPSTVNPAGLRQTAATIAVQEWERWQKGQIKECEPRILPVLQSYWQQGVGYVPSQTDWCSGVAWSAAFISWVMSRAGAGSAFKYSSAHTDYVGEAKRNRLANNSNPFKTYRLSERAPRVGDLICKERANSGVTYDNVDQGFRSSHCDIVTRVLPGSVETVGGNLSDSVRKNTVNTDQSGMVTDSDCYAIVQVGV